MSVSAAMQPHYLPWPGYFSLLMRSDIFWILDNVDIDRRSWQTRNYVANKGSACLLSVPLDQGKVSLSRRISEAKVYSPESLKRHLETIYHFYRKSKVFDTVFPLLQSIYCNPAMSSLSELSIQLVKLQMSYLGLNTDMKLASTLPTNRLKSERILELVLKSGSTIYLSPIGSKPYLDIKSFQRHGVDVAFQLADLPPVFSMIDGKAMSLLHYIFTLSIDEIIEGLNAFQFETHACGNPG